MDHRGVQAFYSGDKLHKFKSKAAMEAWESWSENKQRGIDAANAKRAAARKEAKAQADAKKRAKEQVSGSTTFACFVPG